MKTSIFNVLLALFCLVILAIGCAESPQQTDSGSEPAADEKPISLNAKALTKEYDDNELAADGKYKGKLLAVSGKISDISETFGTINVSLEGHDIVQTVMCGFEEAEKPKVAALKKGQNTTLIGRGDGSTAGLFVGLQKCRIQ